MNDLTEPFLSNVFGDRYLYSINREDFNQKGADATYQAKLQPSFFREDTLHLVIGTDSGLLPNYLLKKGIPKGSRYLFIEPEFVLKRIKQTKALTANRIHAGTPSNIFKVLNEETELGESFYFFLGNVQLHRSIAATKAHLEDYDDIYNQIDEEQQVRSKFHRLTGNTQLHKINTLLNSASSFHPAHCIKGIFGGKTAVIIAPGPSFDNHISWLKTNRDKLVIISISRVCATLVKNDITPDIIVSIDPITLNYKQSIQMLNFTDSLFVHSSHCNFNMTSLWPDKKIYMGSLVPWASKINEPSIPSRGYTVSNIALDLADWLGANQIVLLGVDMCLNRSGDMYTKSEANHAYPITPRLMRVTTNDGESSMSIPDYTESARGIAIQAEEFLEKGVQVINPSKKAMKIDFVEHIATDEIQLQALDEPAIETINHHLETSDKEQHWRKLEKEIRRMLTQLQSIEKRVDSGRSIIKKIKSGTKEKGNPYSKLRKINSQLAENENATFVKVMNWVDFARISLILESEQENSTIQGQERYFEVFSESLDKLKNTLRLPLQYIHLLRKEFRAPPTDGPNIEEWKHFLEQNTFDIDYDASGICFHWHQLYPEKFGALSLEKQQGISVAEKPFVDGLTISKSTEKTAWTSAQVEKNLGNALTLLHKFHQDKDTEGIDFLISALNRYPKEDTAAHIHLCKGLYAEFKNDTDRAVNEYQSVLNITDAKTLPQALKQLFEICVDRNDLDNAIVALEALSEISPPHLAPYADILSIYGNTESAIDNYIKYLHHFPSDPDIPGKLAELLVADDQIDLLIKVCDELLSNNSKSELIKDIRTKALSKQGETDE